MIRGKILQCLYNNINWRNICEKNVNGVKFKVTMTNGPYKNRHTTQNTQCYRHLAYSYVFSLLFILIHRNLFKKCWVMSLYCRMYKCFIILVYRSSHLQYFQCAGRTLSGLTWPCWRRSSCGRRWWAACRTSDLLPWWPAAPVWDWNPAAEVQPPCSCIYFV